MLFILVALGLPCGMQASVVVMRASCGIGELSSSTRDQTWAPCTGSMESYSLGHQGSPPFSVGVQRPDSASKGP